MGFRVLTDQSIKLREIRWSSEVYHPHSSLLSNLIAVRLTHHSDWESLKDINVTGSRASGLLLTTQNTSEHRQSVSSRNYSTIATPSELTEAEVRSLDAYWRACNYLAVGMIYLREQPADDLPGRDPVMAPPAYSRPVYLEGTYSEIYPDKSRGRRGHAPLLQAVFLSRPHRQPLHPETPGSIHEGGELGYSSPTPAARCSTTRPDRPAVRGRWRGRNRPPGHLLALNKFLNPIRDGAVLPILTSTATRSPTPPAGPHPLRGAGEPVAWLWLGSALRGGRVSRWPRCTSHGRDHGSLRRSPSSIQREADQR
jgi:hypothetical protein